MDRNEFEKRYIKARREAIGLQFTHLNSMQREAVLTTQGPLLLLAGAGSGKTTVLINRIENLLKYGSGSDCEYVPAFAAEEDLILLENYVKTTPNTPLTPQIADLCAVDPIKPWRIIAITFTNKAAGEMKTRLEKTVQESAEDIWAMTFHSACARMLRRDVDRLGYDRSFTIYDTTDAASLMKRILKDADIDEKTFPPKTVLTYISRAKDAMISAEEFLEEAEKNYDARRKVIGRLYLEYSNRLKSSNAVDFDDLLLLTVKLLMDNPDILQYYQSRFEHVLVDEYQDTNNLQYLFASALAGGRRNICVVGDDDQSIYKFRGATIENILSFENRYSEARVIRLEQNYRSTGYILSAANDVIKNNAGRKGKKLWTQKEHGEKPALHVVEDERAEAQFVADKLMESISAGMNLREHAVLYRMNAQSNQFETAFKRSGIPYRIFGGTGFYERAEIKDMLAYLCVIYNPNDDVRLLRIINNPPRGVGLTTQQRAAGTAAGLNTPIYEVVRNAQNHEILKSAAGRLIQFTDMIAELRDASEKIPLDELYDMLLDRTGYMRMLTEKDTFENQNRIENVRELKTNIIRFINDNGGNLFDFLSETALFTDLDRDDQSVDRVLMMTMHSAKGLEFDTVFIVGAEEGLFPGMRTIGDHGEMEEERRLCYVAITRAMRKLYFTCTRRRMLFGKTTSAEPSRFIREIDGDNIDVFDRTDRFGSSGLSYDFNDGDGFHDEYRGLSNQNHATSAFPSTFPSTPRYKQAFPGAPMPEQLPARPAFEAPPPPAVNSFKEGDAIVHKAFGPGIVLKISQAGGDALLEIDFERDGMKRMMLKSTARYLTKQENPDPGI